MKNVSVRALDACGLLYWLGMPETRPEGQDGAPKTNPVRAPRPEPNRPSESDRAPL
jgi:hypothetical protein